MKLTELLFSLYCQTNDHSLEYQIGNSQIEGATGTYSDGLMHFGNLKAVYKFEELIEFKFKVGQYDYSTLLSDIIRYPGHIIHSQQGGQSPNCFTTIEGQSQKDRFANFEVSGTYLTAKDRKLFGKSSSDPYLLIYSVKNGVRKYLTKTHTITENLNPNWGIIKLDMSQITDNQIFVECWDFDQYSSDDLIGSALYTLGSKNNDEGHFQIAKKT